MPLHGDAKVSEKGNIMKGERVNDPDGFFIREFYQRI